MLGELRARSAERSSTSRGRRRTRARDDRVLGRGALPAPDLGARGAAARRAASTARPTTCAALSSDFHELHSEMFAIDDPDVGGRDRGLAARAGCRCRLQRTRLTQREPGWPAAGRRARADARARVYFAETGRVDAHGAAARRPSRREPASPARRSSSRRSRPSSSTPVRAAARTTAGRHRAGCDGEPSMTGAPDRRGASIDGVRMAILANRFEAIVRRDDEHAVPHRALGRAQHRARLLLRDPDRGRRAAGGGREPADPRHERARHHGARRWPSCTRPAPRRRVPAQLALPRQLARGRPLASSCRSSTTHGAHRFTVLAKAHQADCGNALPTTYVGRRPRRLRGGRADLPVRAGPARLPRHRGRHPHVPRCASACPSSGGATIWRCSARRGSASAAAGARAPRSDGTRSTRYSERLVRLQRAADGRGDPRGCPSGRVSGHERHDPFPGVPDGIPLKVDGRGRRRRGRIEVDLRDNPDCQPCGLNLTEATARAAAMIGVFNGLRRTACRRTPAASGASTCTCARTASSASRATRPAARWRPPTWPIASPAPSQRGDRRARRRATAWPRRARSSPPAGGVISGDDPAAGRRRSSTRCISGRDRRRRRRRTPTAG